MKKEKRIVIKNDDKENTIKKAVHAANEGKMWARFKKTPRLLRYRLRNPRRNSKKHR